MKARPERSSRVFAIRRCSERGCSPMHQRLAELAPADADPS
jgi:hypothetical protein